jgi:hypothetical protein
LTRAGKSFSFSSYIHACPYMGTYRQAHVQCIYPYIFPHTGAHRVHFISVRLSVRPSI